MNYGWLTASPTSEEIERVVWHEFGHIGLLHEHKTGGNIPVES
jgi:hypothetical protein